MITTCLLIAGALAIVCLLIAWYVRKRAQRRRTGLVLYHKPTGVVLEMPAKYEAQAIDQLLADLKKVGGVPLNSPEFQVIRTAGR